MPTIECGGKTIAIDDKGFLANLDDWNEDVARAMAQREGLDALTDEQMTIIKFLREYYKTFSSFPILNYVCKNIHQPRECLNEQFVNPEKAWKIAGLPLLDGVHFVSVDGGKHYLLEECCQRDLLYRALVETQQDQTRAIWHHVADYSSLSALA